MKRLLTLGLAVLSGCQLGGAPAQPSGTDLPAYEIRDTAYFLNQLTDLDRLPYLEDGVVSAQFSSYDRMSRLDPETGEIINNDANGDSGHYLRVDEQTGEGVMAEIDGPGVIVRLWSANPQGKIRFYLDGDTEPTFEFDHAALYRGEIEPFVPPLVWTRQPHNHASDSYFPIPFAKSCRITADKPHTQYYHIGYKTFPHSVQVESFQMPLSSAAKTALAQVVTQWQNPGRDPSMAHRVSPVERTWELAPGQSRAVEFSGPAEVRELRARWDSEMAYANRNLWLTIAWDGEDEPSVNAPLGDFFGVSFHHPDYRSLPLGVVGGEGYSFWRMPFRRSAVITVSNRGSLPATVELSASVVQKKLPRDASHFHAKWRREVSSENFDFPVLEATGKGRFVGMSLFIDNVLGGWWGEGDEKIRVDGEAFPSFFGTGSEDYFGDAWGIRHFENAFHGCLDSPPRQQSCYRWHIIDDVPFESSYRMTIENYSAHELVHNDYATMAYWYALPGSDDFFTEADRDKLLPQTSKIVAGATEAEDLAPYPAGAKRVEGEQYSMGEAVHLPGPAGTSYPFVLKCHDATAYTAEIGMAETPDDAWTATLAGQPVDGRIKLEKGEYPVTITVQRDEGVVFDYLKVNVLREWVKEWMVLGPFELGEDRANFVEAIGPEANYDFDATYDGIGKTVGWFAQDAGDNGLLNLEHSFEIKENAIAFVAVDLIAARDMETRIFLGSDDGAKLWLGDELIYEYAGRRAASPDDDVVPVTLREGVNHLMLKIWQGPGGWGVFLRLDDPDEEITIQRPGASPQM